MIFSTTILVIGITLALITALWGWIRAFYMNSLSPWIEQHCGADAKKICDDVICFLNKGIVVPRRAAKMMWEKFTGIIKKCDFIYNMVDRDHCKVIKRTIIHTGTEYRKREEEQIINESEVPADISKQMFEKNANTASVDSLEIIRKKYEQQLADMA